MEMPELFKWLVGLIQILLLGIGTWVIRKLDTTEKKTETNAVLNASNGKDLSRLEVRVDELEKTVDKNQIDTRDSTHGIRTLIGTEYVTKAEFQRTIDSMNATMRDGFKGVGTEFRQILSDMGITKR